MHRSTPAVLTFLLLAACATDPQLGSSVNNNIAAQTIDMNPKYAGVIMEAGTGERNVAAYRRYLKGTVKQPPNSSSRTLTGGDSGGGGGGTPPQ